VAALTAVVVVPEVPRTDLWTVGGNEDGVSSSVVDNGVEDRKLLDVAVELSILEVSLSAPSG
jgi:hypothetical protein